MKLRNSILLILSLMFCWGISEFGSKIFVASCLVTLFSIILFGFIWKYFQKRIKPKNESAVYSDFEVSNH